LSRRPCTFRQRDLTAAVKAVLAAGCEVVGAEIEPATGKILVVIGKSPEPAAGGSGGNEWDSIR
jgi:hypothetical protein